MADKNGFTFDPKEQKKKALKQLAEVKSSIEELLKTLNEISADNAADKRIPNLQSEKTRLYKMEERLRSFLNS